MRTILAILLMVGLLFPLSAQDVSGAWNGKLEVPGATLRVVFHLEKTDAGYTATMDSPDQGAAGIPTDEATFSKDTLTIVAKALGMVYTGHFQAEENRFVGTFKQGNFEIPLDLSREVLEAEVLPARPQDPTDFPYQQEDVTFENAEAGATLAGTLTLPEGKPVKQVVVL
ncbi:MAG: hypothetical protein KDC44_11870, partial [Phaeodactylibacter sp.]|nr:hypothetical protein [Phaeodactylibacter sp.]